MRVPRCVIKSLTSAYQPRYVNYLIMFRHKRVELQEESREYRQNTGSLGHTGDVREQAEHRRVNSQVSIHSPVSCNHAAAIIRSL